MRFTLFQSELESIWCIGLSKLHIPKYPLKLNIIDVHMNHEHLSKLKRGRYRPPWTDVLAYFLCLYKWDKAWKWYSSWRSRKRNIGILLARYGDHEQELGFDQQNTWFWILKHQNMVIFHQTQGSWTQQFLGNLIEGFGAWLIVLGRSSSEKWIISNGHSHRFP